MARKKYHATTVTYTPGGYGFNKSADKAIGEKIIGPEGCLLNHLHYKAKVDIKWLMVRLWAGSIQLHRDGKSIGG